jgi:hypothetical protein
MLTGIEFEKYDVERSLSKNLIHVRKKVAKKGK